MNARAPLDHARDLIERGLLPIPVPHKAKAPKIARWQTLRLTTNDLPRRFKSAPANIGALLGEPSGWIVDVDLDHPLAVKLADTFLPRTGMTWGRDAKPRSHRLYRLTRPADTRKWPSTKAGMIVELRSTGCQTIAPGSTHPSGEAVRWDDDGEPATIDPANLIAALEALANAVRSELGEGPDATGAPAPRSVSPAPRAPSKYGREALRCEAATVTATREGARNDTLNRAAFNMGTLIGGGEVDRADAEAELLKASQACGLPDHEAQRTIASGIASGLKHPRQRPARARGDTISDTLHAERVVRVKTGATAKKSNGDVVKLPGGTVPISETARNLGERLAKSGNVFVRGGVPMMLRRGEHGQHELYPLRPAAAPSLFETVARLTKDSKSATCGEAVARLILSAGQFLSALPPVRVLSRCPVLVARGDELGVVTGYDRESGVLASGGPVPDMTLTEAREILYSVLADFRFVSDGDRARALAALITPAMAFGGILGGRAPLDTGEADESQTGKGYFFKMRAAIYGARVRTVVQRKGGVGSFDESLSGALVSGAPFVSFDNLRGRIDSTALESLLTEPAFAARVPYNGEVLIDATRVAFSATSNRAEMTPDLANRASIIRLLHQPEGFAFAQFSEGDLLAHIEADPAPYLGAVHAVVRAWWDAGRLTTGETAHSFRAWAGRLDWIMQNLLATGPLLGGMAEAKTRLSNPALGWLRAVVLAALKAGWLGCDLRAHDLLALIGNNPELALSDSEAIDLEDEAEHSAALKLVGQRLGRAFNGRASIIIDGFEITRRESYDDANHRMVKTYRIEPTKTIGIAPKAPVAPVCARTYSTKS